MHGECVDRYGYEMLEALGMDSLPGSGLMGALRLCYAFTLESLTLNHGFGGRGLHYPAAQPDPSTDVC